MQDFQDHLTIKISGKNHYALVAFLKKHGGSAEDIDRFVEEAIVWRILDREMAFRHADTEEGAKLFPSPEYTDTTEPAAA
jgi:hypothetical protein